MCVLARGCTREAAHVYVCARVWARIREGAFVRAGVRACVCMHA